LFDDVALEAIALPRLRKNHNFHNHSDVVQRFINVLQLGTYIRPHRHLRPENSDGFELFLVLQGEVGVLVMDDMGQVLQTERICAQGPTYGIELAEGQFHTLVALAPNSVMFELKEGPYLPIADKDFLPQFPPEGNSEATQQVQEWHRCFASNPVNPASAEPTVQQVS
jgi:cupin fold WbuC family metalloprotein